MSVHDRRIGQYQHITGQQTTICLSRPGILHRIVVNEAAGNAVITVYDNSAASGTTIAVITEPATPNASAFTMEYGLYCETGLTVVTTAADQDITVVYSG